MKVILKQLVCSISVGLFFTSIASANYTDDQLRQLAIEQRDRHIKALGQEVEYMKFSSFDEILNLPMLKFGCLTDTSGNNMIKRDICEQNWNITNKSYKNAEDIFKEEFGNVYEHVIRWDIMKNGEVIFSVNEYPYDTLYECLYNERDNWKMVFENIDRQYGKRRASEANVIKQEMKSKCVQAQNHHWKTAKDYMKEREKALKIQGILRMF